tara:strand:- start:1666 stop:2001 length:336 start_codon:yes stop_codon:yes gene_type:complete
MYQIGDKVEGQGSFEFATLMIIDVDEDDDLPYQVEVLEHPMDEDSEGEIEWVESDDLGELTEFKAVSNNSSEPGIVYIDHSECVARVDSHVFTGRTSTSEMERAIILGLVK